MAVPAHHLAPLGVGGFSPGPALVHGVPDVVVDPDGDGGVTSDLAHHLGADQSATLEVPGQGLVSASSSSRAPKGTWTTTK